ncbi:hypothetical protein [Streptomyces griseoluteus]
MADALLNPAMAEQVERDNGAGRPRPLPAHGAFRRRPGKRAGRAWLRPPSAVDHGGPLIAWTDAVIRLRRGAGGPPSYARRAATPRRRPAAGGRTGPVITRVRER